MKVPCFFYFKFKIFQSSACPWFSILLSHTLVRFNVRIRLFIKIQTTAKKLKSEVIMFLSWWITFLLLFRCAIGQIDIETLVPEILVTLSAPDDTPTTTTVQTLVPLLVDTSTAPSSPSTVELQFPLSLTQTLRTLSENDSQATSITSSSSKTQTSVPLSTQASPKETGFSTSEQFKVQILNAQNWYRAAHGALPLVWNDTLADSSSNWVAGCVWDLEVCFTLTWSIHILKSVHKSAVVLTYVVIIVNSRNRKIICVCCAHQCLWNRQPLRIGTPVLQLVRTRTD